MYLNLVVGDLITNQDRAFLHQPITITIRKASKNLEEQPFLISRTSTAFFFADLLLMARIFCISLSKKPLQFVLSQTNIFICILAHFARLGDLGFLFLYFGFHVDCDYFSFFTARLFATACPLANNRKLYEQWKLNLINLSAEQILYHISFILSMGYYHLYFPLQQLHYIRRSALFHKGFTQAT